MADAAWTREPIYKPIVQATDALKMDGYDDDRVIDALLTVGMTWAQHRYGSRRLSQRLWLLAQQFASEADMLDRTIEASTHGPVN